MAQFSSGFSLPRSHRDLPPFIPPGHHLHREPDQQEVTEYSDQPSLSCSPTNIHHVLLLQTQDMWRQKNCPLSQAEYSQHASQCFSWNHPYLGDRS